MMIPILSNHNFQAPPLGRIEILHHGFAKMIFTPEAHVTEDMLRAAFPGIGYMLDRSHMENGVTYLDEIRILEFSFV